MVTVQKMGLVPLSKTFFSCPFVHVFFDKNCKIFRNRFSFHWILLDLVSSSSRKIDRQRIFFVIAMNSESRLFLPLARSDNTGLKLTA